MIKKVVVLLTALAIVFSLAACGYNPEDNRNYRIVETDYYRFAVHKTKNYAIVYELTELGQEQEVLAVPDTIEGKPVTQIGWEDGQAGYGSVTRGFKSEKLKKIYIPYTVNIIIERTFKECNEFYEIVLLAAQFSKKLDMEWNLYEKKIVISETLYETAFANISKSRFIFPNLIYYWNHNNSLNLNYYWIDYITEESVYLFPQSPVRDGRIFLGWYLDEDCTVPWDGALPVSGDEKLELFAGWNKI